MRINKAQSRIFCNTNATQLFLTLHSIFLGCCCYIYAVSHALGTIVPLNTNWLSLNTWLYLYWCLVVLRLVRRSFPLKSQKLLWFPITNNVNWQRMPKKKKKQNRITIKKIPSILNVNIYHFYSYTQNFFLGLCSIWLLWFQIDIWYQRNEVYL